MSQIAELEALLAEHQDDDEAQQTIQSIDDQLIAEASQAAGASGAEARERQSLKRSKKHLTRV